MTRWLLLGLLTLILPYASNETTAPVDRDDALVRERTANLAAFHQRYLSAKESLMDQHAGHWLVIAGGQVFPAGSRGRPAPAGTMEAALAAARDIHPKARHRFVFRVGEEGEIRYHPTLSQERAYVGSGFLARSGVAWMVSPTGTWFRRDGVSPPTPEAPPAPGYVRVGSGSDGGPALTARLSSPGRQNGRDLRLQIATGYGGHLVIDRAHADALGLERFEIPGHVLLGDGRKLARARAHLTHQIAGLDLLTPAAIQP